MRQAVKFSGKNVFCDPLRHVCVAPLPVDTRDACSRQRGKKSDHGHYWFHRWRPCSLGKSPGNHLLRNELSREPEIEENDNGTVGLDWGTLSSSLLGLAVLPNLILGRLGCILMLSVMCSYLIIGLETFFIQDI